MSTQNATQPSVSRVPGQRGAAGTVPGTATTRTRSNGQLVPYLGYVGYFVGAGLISGGIVHFPLDPARYLVLALVGAAAFMGATVLNEVVLPVSREGRPSLVRVVLASLVLSLGIGMLSGGIAHFLDFPMRGAVLVPLGLISSFIAFVLREADDPLEALASKTGAGVVAVTVAAVFALGQYALHLQTPAADHGHDHGAAGQPLEPVASRV